MKRTLTKLMIVPAFLAACAVGSVGCDDDDDMEDIGASVGEQMDDAADAADEAVNDTRRSVEDAMD